MKRKLLFLGLLFLPLLFISAQDKKPGLAEGLIAAQDQGQSWESRPEPVLVDPGCNTALLKNKLP